MLTNHWKSDIRTAGLLRFSLALTALNIFGYSYLGFEPAVVTPFFTVLFAFSFQIIIELIQAVINKEKPKFLCNIGLANITHFLPAYISSLAISMLLFSNGSLYEIAFATVLAIGSKFVFVAPVVNTRNNTTSFRHFFNPSNFAITVTLLLFPWVGISPPYQFTEFISGIWDIIIVLVLFSAGTALNAKYTKKLFLVYCWFGAFIVQALVRSWIHGTPVLAGLVPMTGLAFILFSFYMITDPPTTPFTRKGQFVFAVSNAVLYAFFMEVHLVFGLFYALTITTCCRGLYLWWDYLELVKSNLNSRTEPLS